jgi:hypothetical protein
MLRQFVISSSAAATAVACHVQVLFKYCPTELLDNNYRRQLVLEEITRYQVAVTKVGGGGESTIEGGGRGVRANCWKRGCESTIVGEKGGWGGESTTVGGRRGEGESTTVGGGGRER